MALTEAVLQVTDPCFLLCLIIQELCLVFLCLPICLCRWLWRYIQ